MADFHMVQKFGGASCYVADYVVVNENCSNSTPLGKAAARSVQGTSTIPAPRVVITGYEKFTLPNVLVQLRGAQMPSITTAKYPIYRPTSWMPDVNMRAELTFS